VAGRQRARALRRVRIEALPRWQLAGAHASKSDAPQVGTLARASKLLKSST
jgi:hypothetical protein